MRYIPCIITLCIITSLTLLACEKFEQCKKNHKKQIALIIAFRNYQPYEYSETKRILSHAGFAITTVSTSMGKARATDNSTTPIDKALNKFKHNGYDAIVMIGGPGAHTELDNETVYSIMREAYNAGKVVGAICYSPRILAQAGILQGKKATGWNDDNELPALFKKYDVFYTPEPVVTDGTIVTADGPMAATAFGKAIVTVMQER